ncbi:MAG TPA: nicotinate-nucleotide diphosphorylase (carboxylating), partial [Pseudobdellovibrionaceae bacterium]|nr:nicotinate-nucleotide diphosphorylase (carboxylating) [Pseudobdellovibrionaceae bacterium]
VNHRLNLSSAILIKDNHISLMGGLAEAVQRVRRNSQLPIEAEASTLEEVQQACLLNVQRILLDNMTNEQIQKALELIPDSISVEASGNMTLNRVRSVAELGVDYISIGALTHSASVADVSLSFERLESNDV